jgi:hypothetical protein
MRKRPARSSNKMSLREALSHRIGDIWGLYGCDSDVCSLWTEEPGSGATSCRCGTLRSLQIAFAACRRTFGSGRKLV